MLRIATLNQFQPGLSSDDLADVGAPLVGGGTKAHVWNALRRWGQQLYRKADIVLLTEVRHGPHMRFLARPDVSGLKHFALWQEEFFTNLGILSRFPLSEVRPLAVDRNYFLAAKADVEGTIHQLIAAHWDLGQFTSSSRRAAAQQMVDIVRQAVGPAFVGGDLNVLSGYGPGGTPGTALSEYLILTTELWDTFTLVAPEPPYCSNQRIDYIFFKGDYETKEFHACLDPQPSDHPFVIVTLEQRGLTSSSIRTHAPVTAVTPTPGQALVVGVSDDTIDEGRIFVGWQAPNSTFDGWHQLTSPWTSTPARSIPESFVACAVESAQPYLVWIGPDGWVMHAWPVADGKWFWWPIGNSNDPSLHGVPGGAVDAVSCQVGTLHVFYAGADGRIFAARRDTAAGGTWPEHRWLLNGVTAPGGHVTAVSRRPGQLDVFCVGTDGRVYTAAWNSQDSWRGWWPVGDLRAVPGTRVAVVSRRLDFLDVFVPDVDGRTMSAAWEPGADWRGWWHIQGGLTGTNGYVTALSPATDRLEIFTVGLDWRVFAASWAPNTGWVGWVPIEGTSSQTPPWPVTRSPGTLEVFFVSSEGNIEICSRAASGGWTGPTMLADAWS
jgi:endonuclease/exonuclease/phosphatase family metal-dependent hydrolase